ncbi:hypothetical protein [Ferribacterium limneticum]|uniref:hypothetical protein n=1 Tax=Ferribacterium limneticum TaxID=76259 RepID=UPI001CF8DBBD|nr:hypothetical protein [Ferribacterium limneticum]UCV26785.1 hypothetical protein KI617_10730 [Ferribacterium limneticum]UCV30702.1 hypothetical protein KI608_10730 [Ferribacterium limneticum]
MPSVVFDGGGGSIRAFVGAENPTVAIAPTQEVVATFSEPVQTQDIVLNKVTDEAVRTNAQVTVTESSIRPGYTFSNQTPAVCTIDGSGLVTCVGPGGLAKIRVRTLCAEYEVSQYLSYAPVVHEQVSSYAAGSLAWHIDNAIRGMIEGKTGDASTRNLFLTASGGTSAPNYIRNPNLFSGALDLSAITVATAGLPAVLISPRHLMVGHATLPNNSQVVFKDSAGDYQTRTVQSSIAVRIGGDNSVALLNEAVTSIEPISFLPATWANYIPSFRAEAYVDSQLYPIPVLNIGRTAATRLRVIPSRVSGNNWWTGTMAITPSAFADWGTNHSNPALAGVIGGDSNGPVFVPINGKPVLLHCMNFGGLGGSGDFYPAMLDQIDAAMTSLGGGYVSTKADITMFPSY